ncbi:MAG: response regulator [Bacillota bacterium]
MFRMLIVDDEVNTAHNLATIIPWSELGITEVEIAYNGNEALQKAINFHPDIILSDIVMPKMNGIDLAHKISNLTNSHVIFITGHWDESYVKSAFKAGVVDYILKPVDLSELRTTVKSVVKKLSESTRQKQYIAHLESQYQKSLPFLRDRLFLALISGIISDSAKLEEELVRLDMRMPVNMSYSVFCLKVQPLSQSDKPALVDHLLALEVVHLCNGLLQLHGCGYCLRHTADYYVCVVPLIELDTAVEEIDTLANQMKSLLQSSLSVEVTIGIGEWVDNLIDIGYSFEKARQAIFYMGRNSIVFADKVPFPKRGNKALSVHRLIEITEHLQYGHIEKAVEGIDEIFSVMKHNQNEDPVKTIDVCIQLYTMLNSVLVKSAFSEGEDLDGYTAAIRKIYEAATLEEVRAIILDRCIYINDTFQKERQSENRIVRQMKDYIGDHYKENLTIDQIAQHVYLSKSYCCLLFKQEIGITINQYITELRMQDAQKMIASGNQNIIDICFELGYNDPKYFSRVFKKMFGVSPTEFRRLSR